MLEELLKTEIDPMKRPMEEERLLAEEQDKLKQLHKTGDKKAY